MKLAESTVSKSGNMTFRKKKAMLIDPSATSMILDNLIKMYSNPYASVLREYTSNAIDSHRAAGQTRPVEVSLPNVLSPSLVIQDWGLGLSEDELDMYGQFGFSDKRDSNDAIGGFGLGSKSGLAVAAEFTVRSVKDGKRNTVIVGRDKLGAPDMSYLEEVDTDEPNGVRITIPITDDTRFRQAIDNGLFFGWEPGSILINGKAPDNTVYSDDYVDMGDPGWLLKSALRGSAYYPAANNNSIPAIIRGVTIPVDITKLNLEYNYELTRYFLRRAILNVDNGEVELLRSREDLIYDARTRAHLTEKVKKMIEFGAIEHQENIDNAETLREAYSARKWAIEQGFRDTKFHFKGRSLELPAMDFEFAKTPVTYATISYDNRMQRSNMNHQHLQNMHSELVANSKIVIVEKAQAPTEVRAGSSLKHHPETSLVRYWAKKFAAENDMPISKVRLYFTESKASEFHENLRDLFGTVIDGKTFKTEAEAARKEFLAEARKARAEAKAARSEDDDEPEEFMTLSRKLIINPYNAYGYPRDIYLEEMIEEGPLTSKVVLFKNDASKLGNIVKRIITTQVGRSEHLDISNFISEHPSLDNWVILTANKSWKTDEYEDILGVKVHTPEEFVQELINEMDNKATPEDFQHSADRRALGYTNWTARIKEKHLEDIENEDTRAWIKSVQNDEMDVRIKNAETAAKVATKLGLTAPKMGSPASQVSPLVSKYPLLTHVGYSNARSEDIVDYINMLDSRTASE